jgi:hypothetical protein
MIHFVPDSDAQAVQAPYAEAVARLAGLRQALTLVEGMAGMSPSPATNENRVAMIEGEARKARFDARSSRAVAGSAAGLEAIATLKAEGRQAHPAAAERLALDIRSRLEELGAVLSL